MAIAEFPVRRVFDAGHSPAVVCGDYSRLPTQQVSPARATFRKDGIPIGQVQVVGAADPPRPRRGSVRRHAEFALRVSAIPDALADGVGRQRIVLTIEELLPGPAWPDPALDIPAARHDASYDENSVLTRYVLVHYANLATARHTRILKAADLSFAAERQAWVGEWRNHYQPFQDESVREALAAGPEVALEQVAREIANRRGVYVNRCPECGRIVKTPLARQCLWCGHDWH